MYFSISRDKREIECLRQKKQKKKHKGEREFLGFLVLKSKSTKKIAAHFSSEVPKFSGIFKIFPPLSAFRRSFRKAYFQVLMPSGRIPIV
jgi:hypothetical protein